MKYEITEPKSNPTKYEIKPMYGLEQEESKAMAKRVRWELFDAEYYAFIFKTENMDMLERFIPPPLKLVPTMSLLDLCVQQLNLNDGKGNDGLNAGYYENIIGAFADYKGTVGFYPFAIHIESDIGAIAGREMLGTAKKVGNFEFKRDGNKFTMKTIRREIAIVEAEGEILPKQVNSSIATSLLEKPTYHLHQVMGPILGNEGPYYAYKPRLMTLWARIDKVHAFHNIDNIKFGFNESPYDPICLVKPSELMGAFYLKANTSITLDPKYDELDEEEMIPFLFSKFDPF